VLLGASLTLLAGCGSSDGGDPSTGEAPTRGPSSAPGVAVGSCKIGGVAGVSEARVSGADCPLARGVVSRWNESEACRAPVGSSRTACSIGGLRCLGAATGRVLVVSCAGAGRSISFLARRS
jgi:hypothetical protein